MTPCTEQAQINVCLVGFRTHKTFSGLQRKEKQEKWTIQLLNGAPPPPSIHLPQQTHMKNSGQKELQLMTEKGWISLPG